MTGARLLSHFDYIVDAPDAVPRVRRFIVDLAVRGRLVPQDPEDGDSASLLHEIEEAWATPRSNGQGKRKKAKRWAAPAFSDIPFRVPKNWALVRLGHAVELINGRAFKPSDWTPTGIPIVRIQNLNNPAAPFNHCDGDVDSRFLIDRGDFLISWSGTPGTSFGAHIWERGQAVLNQHIFKSILVGDAFESRFLKLAINARLLELIEQAHGGVGLRHITKPKLEALVLTLPPLAEQQRIVATVDEMMALCDRLEASIAEQEATRDRFSAATFARLSDPDPDTFQLSATFAIKNLTELTTRLDQIDAVRQAIIDLAVRGKLVRHTPNDEPASELLNRIAEEKRCVSKRRKIRREGSAELRAANDLCFELPTGWAKGRFTDFIVELQTGPFGSSLHQSDYEIGGTPVINPASMQNGKIVPVKKMAVAMRTLERLKRFRLCAGDIVMARRGDMGRCAVVTERESGWLCGTGSLIVRLPECMNPWYLKTLIESPMVREYLDNAAVGSTMRNLNQSILLKMSIGMPPLAEQHRIVAKVIELMAICDRLETSLASAEDGRRRVLEALLREAMEPATRDVAPLATSPAEGRTVAS